MRMLQLADRARYPRMTTAELREAFLIDDLFQPGAINQVYVELDRAVVGSAVPLAEPLRLAADAELRAEFFCERRELGVLNTGAAGTVVADGVRYPLAPLESLYVGRGTREVTLESDNAAEPAQFYLLSYPAQAMFPTAKVMETLPLELGSAETCNRRRINKCIHLEGVRSAQLVMGFTELAPGSNWNTLPAHTHIRRSEIYLYFNLGPEDRVLHLMGPGEETRHLVVANRQAVVSPLWSIHAGVGTRAYSFCWGMGGENQVYSDMDPVATSALR